MPRHWHTTNLKTTINFDIDAQLKSEAERQARKQGTSLSTVLSDATRAFVDNQLVMGIDNDIVEYVARSRGDLEQNALDS